MRRKWKPCVLEPRPVNLQSDPSPSHVGIQRNQETKHQCEQNAPDSNLSTGKGSTRNHLGHSQHSICQHIPIYHWHALPMLYSHKSSMAYVSWGFWHTMTMFIILIILSPVWMGSTEISVSACQSVHECISKSTHPNFHQIFSEWLLLVAWSLSCYMHFDPPCTLVLRMIKFCTLMDTGKV